MTGRDSARLTGVHPLLVQLLTKILAQMAQAGFAMFVVQGVRALADQQIDYAKGRTTKGPIVTNCDGIKKKSAHQFADDGWGHAVDCAFLGPEPFAPDHNWHLYGTLAADEGLIWGGNFHDRPGDFTHVELTADQLMTWQKQQQQQPSSPSS